MLQNTAEISTGTRIRMRRSQGLFRTGLRILTFMFLPHTILFLQNCMEIIWSCRLLKNGRIMEFISMILEGIDFIAFMLVYPKIIYHEKTLCGEKNLSRKIAYIFRSK